MSMFLAEALSEAFSKTPNKTLAYFFYDVGYDTRKTATAIVHRLLLQLVQQHLRLIEHVLPKYEERKARAFDSFDASGRKYCVVDALDECKKDEQDTLLKQIEETFGRDRSSACTLNLSILITSRPQDIDKFIDEKVGLACQELEKVASKRAVTCLEKIPLGLQSLYNQLLDTALQQDEDPDTVKRLLGFVIVVQRPLSTPELASAYHLYQDEDEEERFISELEAYSALASRCIDCLIAKYSSPGGGHTKGDNDFVPYSTQFWPDHAHMAKEEFQIEARQAEFFSIDSRTRNTWWKEFLLQSFWGPSTVSVFHLAARWGIPLIVKNALSSENRPSGETAPFSLYIDSAYKGSNRTTPLEECAMSGHIDVFCLMLERGNPLSHVKGNVISAAVRNRERGAALLKVLFDQRRDQVTITEDIVTTTEDIVEAAARNWDSGAKVMELLLGRKGDQVTITEDIVKAAAGNRGSGAEVMELLLGRKGDQVMITENIVKAAAGNWDSGAEVMELLLGRKGEQITITENIVKAAAENSWSGAKVMELLLDQKGDQVTTTENIVKAAAGNERSGAEVMELLLGRKGD
ncbi:hypothetical protein N658DRAFT_488640 [Parathielavia hyrcaniae]|uniref:Nephrocystin 3-like N-terminal domain-containing protein n=1 Tax=Parathielavia hyrcaniae TaxID=113614 RepID=A0AAN6PUQ4_9PEZI|nr:hypothetical protein N658DRAFT_488640 [Parathielavia hyrcaniae]